MNELRITVTKENLSLVGNTLLFGAYYFQPKDVEVGGISSSALRWETAAAAHLSTFLMGLMAKGIDAVSLFREDAIRQRYPIAMPPNIATTINVSTLSTEVPLDLSIELIFNENYWTNCSAFFEKYGLHVS